MPKCEVVAVTEASIPRRGYKDRPRGPRVFRNRSSYLGRVSGGVVDYNCPDPYPWGRPLGIYRAQALDSKCRGLVADNHNGYFDCAHIILLSRSARGLVRPFVAHT